LGAGCGGRLTCDGRAHAGRTTKPCGSDVSMLTLSRR
jgi:hypothetical protein